MFYLQHKGTGQFAHATLPGVQTPNLREAARFNTWHDASNFAAKFRLADWDIIEL